MSAAPNLGRRLYLRNYPLGWNRPHIGKLNGYWVFVANFCSEANIMAAREHVRKLRKKQDKE